MSLPVVAIIGRPNVGKSSLFNRFLRKKIAVVDEVAGVTRDRNFSKCEWTGHEFYLIDTGGMVPGPEEVLAYLETIIADGFIPNGQAHAGNNRQNFKH